jgi:hydrogenase-4 membrane subunit HyfE
MTLVFFIPLIAIVELFFVIATIGAPRLVVAVRNYLFASAVLVLIMFFIGATEGSHELFALAIFAMLVKCLLIPLFILREVDPGALGQRIPSFIRTTPLRIIGVTIALLFLLAENMLSGLTASVSGMILIAAAGTSFVFGFLGLIVNRNIPSKILALLTMENGVALCFLVVGRALPLPIEIGFLLVILMASYLMIILWRNVHKMTGIDETASFNTLAE